MNGGVAASSLAPRVQPKTHPSVRTVTQPAPPPGAPRSSIQDIIDQLAQGPSLPAAPDYSSPDFTSAVDQGVHAQLDPQISAYKYQQSHQKYLYDQEAENAKGFTEGLTKILTGGNVGDAGMQYGKDNFGGSYLGAISAQQGTQLLQHITQDFNDKDWQVASKIADLMASEPGVREKVASDIKASMDASYKQDYNAAQDTWANKVKIAGLLIDAHREDRLSQPGPASQPKVSTTLSAGNGFLTDVYGNAILGKNGKPLPYTPYQAPKGAAGAPKVNTTLSKTFGYLMDSSGNPILRNGQTVPVPKSAAAAASGAKPSSSLSKIYGYVVDTNGNPVLRNGKRIPVKTSATQPHVQSASEQRLIAERKGDAAAIAVEAFNGSKENPKLNFGQALAEMRLGVAKSDGTSKGAIPLSIAIPALQRAGYKVPPKYGKYLSGGGQSDPLAPSGPGIVGPGLGAATKVVEVAKQFLGVPYVWGGNDPAKALDCSSFIQQTFKRLGVDLPRTTYDQVKAGVGVSLNQLQPGDAIFTRPGKNGPNHVGLYIGNGLVQESPHTGDVNKIIPLQSFLTGGFVAARRYLGN